MSIRGWGNGATLMALCLALAGGGCKEAKELYDRSKEKSKEFAGEKEGEEEEFEPPPLTAGVDKPRTDKYDGSQLESGSPEARLKAEIVKRLECEDPACGKAILKRIRSNQDYYLPGLSKLMVGQPRQVTLEAVRIAGLLRYKGAIEALGRVASRAEPSLRGEAIWALGSMKDKASVTELTELVGLGLSDDAHRDICKAFKKLAFSAIIEPALKLLAEGSTRTKTACVRALGATKDPRVLPHFERIGLQGQPEVKQAVKEALTDFPGKEAQKILRLLR